MDGQTESTDNGHAGTDPAAAGTVTAPVGDTPQTGRQSVKRMLSEDTNDSPMRDIADASDDFDFPDAPPDGVHPNMWVMLRSINRKLSRVDSIENRLDAIDDLLDNDGAQLAILKNKMERLESSNKTITGRLIRAEAVIQRQQTEITDLRMRSMRDNIIIRTSGPKYKETREENTASTVRKFLNEEMRIPDTGNISINSSHRMGQAGPGYNKMLIARIPRREDHNKIFDNASVLKGTNYYVSKQVPVEVDERRQFAWSEYKQAKADKRPARFDGGTLVVGGEPVTKFNPVALPATSQTLLGAGPAIPRGASDVCEEADHRFQAWALPAKCVDNVREGLDQILQMPELSDASYVPYAYRFTDGRGHSENFSSDGDTNSGIMMMKILRELSANNVVVFVAHHSHGKPLPKRKKMVCLANVIGGATMALTAVVTP